MLSTAIAIFLFASVVCAMAQSMPMLVGARVMQGLGGGGLISIAQAIIADVVSPRERGRYQGYVSGAFAVASVSGPLLGGLLTQYLSWRWVFWINLPLGLFALAVSRRALARLPVPHIKRPIDYLGAALLAAGLSALLIAITLVGQGAAWLAAENLVLWGIALFCLLAFVAQEQRAPEPIVPLWLFRDATVTISCAIMFIAFFQIISLSVLIPLRLQMLTHLGADGAALRLMPLSLAIPVGAYIGGKLMTRSGRYKRIQFSGTVVVPFAVLSLAFIGPQSTLASMFAMALAGLGLGIQLPAATVAIQNAVPHRHVGVATSVSAFCRSLGAAIGIAVLTALLFASMHANAPALAEALSGADIIKTLVADAATHTHSAVAAQLKKPVQDAFQLVFMISALFSVAACVLALRLTDETLSQQAPKLV